MKSKTHSNNRSNIADSELQEQIRRKAHQIWLANGCCHGNDMHHWLEAERQVLAKFQRQSPKHS